MYTQHFGLTESPFTNSLDPHWFYESSTHEEAMARLLYLVEQRRRCGVLVGPTGTGKSLVMNLLASQVRRMPAEVVLIDLMGRSGREMLWETVAALGMAPRGDECPRVLWRILCDHLATNRYVHSPTVVFFDHVDRAEPDCLTAVERLYHSCAGGETGMTLILGARGGRTARSTQILSAIADLQVELLPLDREQTEEYITTLATRAGAVEPLFEAAACERIFAESRGIPRDINRLCDLSLVAGMADGIRCVTEGIVAGAAEQLHPLRHAAPIFRTRRREMAEL
jgi:hypothetical protein